MRATVFVASWHFACAAYWSTGAFRDGDTWSRVCLAITVFCGLAMAGQFAIQLSGKEGS